MTQPLLTKETEFTECVICQKPLGQDSRNLGYSLCHEHRKCIYCEKDISPAENITCLKALRERRSALSNGTPPDYSEITVTHASCWIQNQRKIDDPEITVRQSTYDFANLCRLAIIPELELNAKTNRENAEVEGHKLVQNMDYLEKTMFIERLEAIASFQRMLLKQDPKFNKELLELREKQKASVARVEASTSARPQPKVRAQDVQLAHFMEIYNIKEAEVGKKLLVQFNKAIQDLQNRSGFDEPTAREMVARVMKLQRKVE